MRKVVKLRQLATPDQIELSHQVDQVFVITDDGTRTTSILAKTLQKQGWNHIAVLQFPAAVFPSSHHLPKNAHLFPLPGTGETSVKQTLATIQQKLGTICGFIHLHPSIPSHTGEIFSLPDAEKQILKTIFFIAKYLKKNLLEAAKNDRSCFLAVTRLNGRLGFGDCKNINPMAGGLYGLIKTINLEWDPVFCRAIDLDPDFNGEQSAQKIITELNDADCRLTEVGHGGKMRVTLTAEISGNIDSSTENSAAIDESSVFLVSGGAKGITAACVIHLASRYRCKFILLGRSQPPAVEPDWAKDCWDDTELKKRCMDQFLAEGEKPTPVKIMNRLKPLLGGREIRATLESLADFGSQAEYIQADITEAERLQQQLSPVVDRFGDVTGIIHGAGVLADKYIEEKTEKDFEIVYSTKIEGLKSLLSCVSAEDLSYLILFSSAAGFFGNQGQSDYAAANEILNKFAHGFKQQFPSCHVTAFNWGPWDGGMVTPELKKHFAQKEIDVIPLEVGSQIMTDELNPENKMISQVVVGNSMIVPKEPGTELKTYRIIRKLTLEENVFLKDHVIGGEPVLPIICAISWMADSCEQLYPGYHFWCCEEVRVLKGIVFNQNMADEFFVDIKETAKAETDVLDFEVKISSLNKKGKTDFHYSSHIKLVTKLPEPPTYSNFDTAEKHVMPGIEFYNNGTLFHGPVFQGLRKMLNISPEKLTLECKTAELTETNQGSFSARTFNPYAEDCHLQSLLVWVRHHFQAGSLPLKIEKGEFMQRIPFDTEFYISLDVKSSNQTQLVADITAHDVNGKIYSRLFGAEAIISKNLNKKFMKTPPA